MKVIQFLLYYKFSDQCPDHVHPLRWGAMVKWFWKRMEEGEIPFD
jgi:hypothetical protein